ncbi:helix-turn-helix transcriptional regulator [Gordonia sp. CPCC 205515]|uniref:helix-turn-helix domain-containing protein n=1 Tax=Gordonia sp. CPCC 205515 TaxID=3140791 RepID=UPI003AF3FF86
MSETDDVEEPAAPSAPGAPSYLRAARRAAGLSQSQLAEAAGLAVRTISIIESGDSNPRAATLTAIAEALGIDAGELVGAFATNTPPGITTPPPTSDRHVTVAAADLAALFDTVATVASTGALDDRHTKDITARAGRLFTAYAVALLEHALAHPDTHSIDPMAGLIRLQLHQYPDDSEQRRYLVWLLGDDDAAAKDDLVRYHARRDLLGRRSSE